MSKIETYPTGTAARTTKLIGTNTVGGSDVTENILVGDITLLNFVSAPATASSTGTLGDYATDTSFAYHCVATDTWLRVAIATW